MDKSSERCERAPRDQRYREEEPRAPAFNQQRSWNLQREIADEENSARGSEAGVAQAEIALHPERRVGDVRTIEVVRDVKEKKERQKPPRNATARTFPSA